MLNFIKKNSISIAQFFFLLYAYTIILPRGTKDYKSLNFYLIIFQALGTVLIGNYLFNKFVIPPKKSTSESSKNDLNDI
jgi:hypothetical protein